MAENPIRVRLLLGKYEEDLAPVIAGAMDEGIYEVIDDNEWQEYVKAWKRSIDPLGHIGYMFREVVVALPRDEINAIFDVLEVSGEVEPVVDGDAS